MIEALQEPKPGAAPLAMAEMHVARPRDQFGALLRRNFTTYWRSPEYNITRAAVTLLVAFAFGSMFWRLGSHRNTTSVRRYVWVGVYGGWGGGWGVRLAAALSCLPGERRQQA